MLDIQHPEITWAENTGYPSWNQPVDNVCNYCRDRLEDGEEAYEDESYECLCLACLLKLHLKED